MGGQCGSMQAGRAGFESLNFEVFVFGSGQEVSCWFRLDGDLGAGVWTPFAPESIIVAVVLAAAGDPEVESCERSASLAVFWLSVGRLPARMSARYSVSESTEDSLIFPFPLLAFQFSELV